MDGPIIGYVRICVDPLGRPQGAIWAHFGPKKWVFLKIFIRILRFIWDLGLVSSDSRRDVVSGKNLFFGKIICFPGVNWAQNSNKTENFGYVLGPQKLQFFKKRYITFRYLWGLALVKILAKSHVFCGSYGPKTPKIGPNWVIKQKKQVYLPGKVKNGKYPDLDTCEFVNYGLMILLWAMWEFVLTLWGGPRGQFAPILGPKNGYLW